LEEDQRRTYGSDRTDTLLVEALEEVAPWRTPRGKVGEHWTMVAERCRQKEAEIRRPGEHMHFREATGESVSKRYRHLRDKWLAYEKWASSATGTTEGPSELLRRIGRLYSAEQGRRVETAVEKEKLAQQRRDNYRLGKVAKEMSLLTRPRSSRPTIRHSSDNSNTPPNSALPDGEESPRLTSPSSFSPSPPARAQSATPLPTAHSFNTTHELACNVLELLRRDAQETTNTETLLNRFEQSNNRILEAMQMQSRDILEVIKEQSKASQRESRDFRTALLQSQNQVIELAKALTRKQ